MFITMKTLHLTNTFWVYVIPAIVQPYNIILVKLMWNPFPGLYRKQRRLTARGHLRFLQDYSAGLYADPGNSGYLRGSCTVELLPGYPDIHHRPEALLFAVSPVHLY